jgi:glycosyltransferase involved in cell wall biosynthesis
VVAVSEPDRMTLMQMAPTAKISVVPNGVDTTYFIPAPTVPDSRFIFSGAMFWYPNIDAVCWFLGAIWPSIRREIPDAQLDIVGCDPPGIIRAFDQSSGIRVMPDVADIRPYLRGSAVSVVPVRVGSGSRLKILEAMASGRAVVSTTTGMEGLDLTPDREIIQTDKPLAFAAVGVELIRNRAKRDSLGRAGREAVCSRYDWSVVLSGWNRICVGTGKGE